MWAKAACRELTCHVFVNIVSNSRCEVSRLAEQVRRVKSEHQAACNTNLHAAEAQLCYLSVVVRELAWPVVGS